MILVAAFLTLATSPTTDLLTGSESRIQQFRTSSLTIRVVDNDGQPVPGVKVHIKQLRHSFHFGAGALTLLKHKDLKNEARYQELFSGPFNFATLLSYWHEMDREQGKSDYALLDAQVKRLGEMGIAVKAHPMILAGAAPGWAPSDPEAAKRLTEERIRSLAGRYKGRIGFWDVVGDATTAHHARNGLGEWAKKAGAGDFTADPFRWARSADPSATLIYNEYNLDDALHRLVEDLKARKAAPDVVGLEAHMTDRLWSLQEVWDHTERFAKLGIPLHWSELTVPSGKRRPDGGWEVTPETEQAQAEYVEQLYTLLFSHPAVKGITWWNPVDGDWDTLPGGLIRKDLTPKPSYTRLMSLIRERWWTDERRTTDENGETSVSGYHGDYRVTVEVGGLRREINMKSLPGKPQKRTIRLP